MQTQIKFGATSAYTVGIEEEFQLIDPATRELAPAIATVLENASGDTGLAASELLQACVEMRTPVFSTGRELSRELPNLRRRIRDLARTAGVELAASGTHPCSSPQDQKFTEEDRYLQVEEAMGWVAQTQAIYGQHVHVAVPDAEEAIRAVNALARHVPLMISLSANSPFWRGVDTRLASTRIKIFDIFPRSGLPPTFHDWEEFESYVDTLIAAGSIPDYTWCWWDVRPHPKLGTVELRVLDVQTNPAYAASLTALTQCLVANADRYPQEYIHFTAENKWRATRYGLDAHFYDFSTGREVEARDLARSLVEESRSTAQDLGCESELEGILEIIQRGNGAEQQRAALKKHGSLQGVVDYLVQSTTPDY